MRIHGETGAAGLPAQVEAVEPVGNEAFVNLRCGEGEIILRQPPHDLPSPGDVVQLGHVPARAHFFDSETGVRLRSEEHTSELQSLMRTSYAVFCLKKKNNETHIHNT